jgi:hypothetical protein
MGDQDGDEEENYSENSAQEPGPTDFYSRFERLNHRLNAFFGFE